MSKYRVFLHDISGSTPADHLLDDAKLEGFSRRINSYGQAKFTIPRFSTNATNDKLKKYRRVSIFRRKNTSATSFECVWFGYIESHNKAGETELQVNCMEMLKFFKKRFTADSEQFTGQGSTEAFGLLSDTNTNDGATGVSQGTGGVTTTKNLQMAGADILRAWEFLAEAHNAEFEIDCTGKFNFVSSIGTDKSSTVLLVFRRDETPGSNIRDYEDGEDGEDMVNKLIGKSSAGGGLTSTQQDSTSQTNHGVLIGKKVFNEAQDQSTLDQMTSSTLTQIANPLADTKLLPLIGVRRYNPITNQREVSTLDYSSFGLGDLVSVRIITENQNIDTTRRIAEIEVSVNDEDEEDISITTTKAGVFITAAYLDFDLVKELKRKIQELELVI